MRWMLLVLVPAAALAGPTDPDGVVRSYLEAGARSDLEAVAALVEPDCTVRSVLNVSPTLFLGSRLTLDSLEVQPAVITADTAAVRFALTGSTRGDVQSAPGSKVQIAISGLKVSGYSVDGELHTVKTGGAWKVACRDWMGRDEPGIVLEPAP